MKSFKELLIELDACNDSKVWAQEKKIEEVVSICHRGDWLLWLAKKIDLPLNKLTLAKARCAKTVIHLMKDRRSIKAVHIAESFGLDECTLEKLNAADYAAYAASYAAAAYAAARKKKEKEKADICKEILGNLIIEKVNKLLCE